MEKQSILLNRFQEVRSKTVKNSQELEVEDFIIQASEFVSPAKWHLAHVTWFFEEFVLSSDSAYEKFNIKYS